MNDSYFSPPFSGVPTFAKFPFSDLDSFKEIEKKIGIIGVPYDMGSTNIPGSRLAPRAVRSASTRFSYTVSANMGGVRSDRSFYDIELGRSTSTLPCFDLGDVPVLAGDPKASFASITSIAKKLGEKNILPIWIGGDHAITSPILEGTCTDSKVTIIHLDAHMDFWDPADNSDFDHSCCMWRASKMSHIGRIIQFGIRGLNHSEVLVQNARNNKVEMFTGLQLAENRFEILKNLKITGDVYLSIDIDFFDPSIAPATGTPEVGGGSYHDFKSILNKLDAKNINLIGADLVEVNPLLDGNGTTANLAARVIMDLVGFTGLRS